MNKSKENQLEGITNKQALPTKLIFCYETVATPAKKRRYKKLATRKHLPQLTKRKPCLSATHMPWHSEPARNKRSRDDDFIRGSKKEKYDWNAGQASSRRPGPCPVAQGRALGKETLEDKTSPGRLQVMQNTKGSSQPPAGGEHPAEALGEVRLALGLSSDLPMELCSSLSCPVHQVSA